MMESTDKQKEAWEWAEQATRLSLACRTASHWWEASGVEARSLLKLYGIRFDILVAGRVGGARWGGQGGSLQGISGMRTGVGGAGGERVDVVLSRHLPATLAHGRS